MRLRRYASLACRTIAGIGSFMVSLFGVYMLYGSGLRVDSLMAGIFVLLPLLSFPAFILIVWKHTWSAALHWIMAFAYLIVFSMMDWRTCSELGYCISPLVTLLESFKAHPVQATFAVAIFNLAASLLKPCRAPSGRAENSTG